MRSRPAFLPAALTTATAIVSAALLGATLSGCGTTTQSAGYQTADQASSQTTAQATAQPTQSVSNTASQSAGAQTGEPAKGQAMNTSPYADVTGACGSEPTLRVKTGHAPATQLLMRDLCPGTGAVVQTGGTVTAHYTGIGLSTGKEFDSSWRRGQPIQFPLSSVIAGWSEGIPGMRVGGRRVLVIPGSMAYGPNPPQGSGIQPNETLVFVVDIVSSP